MIAVADRTEYRKGFIELTLNDAIDKAGPEFSHAAYKLKSLLEGLAGAIRDSRHGNACGVEMAAQAIDLASSLVHHALSDLVESPSVLYRQDGSVEWLEPD